jgi:hypothetical protein
MGKAAAERSAPPCTVELVCVGVVDVDAKDLPIRFSIVDHGQDTQDLDLLDFTHASHLRPNRGMS